MYQVMDEYDPDNQLQWLVDELDWAERHGERVYIIGHMPMGSSDSFHDTSNYFDQIINRYKSTISAIFFGIEFISVVSRHCEGLSANLIHRAYPFGPVPN
jgi:hypothetical protein